MLACVLLAHDGWSYGPLVAPLEAYERAAVGRRTPYLQSKAHILDALEVQAPALIAEPIWQRNRTVLDVGAGSGEACLYLHNQHGVRCRALDVRLPNSRYWKSHAPAGAASAAFLPIELFDGETLPARNASCDIVMFNSVLHHAAEKAVSLLSEAARVARRHILIIEDLHIPNHSNVAIRNLVHDPRGIFRTLSEWMLLIRGAPGVTIVWHDMLCQHMDDTRLPCYSFNTSHRLFYALFVVEVRPRQTNARER
jgi:2-polyprenyl-3-methyl-5-hydroxy-6-metoxy-1,4-benzoquinol methylase